MIFQDKNTTRIAVAMGSELDFSDGKLHFAYEDLTGGGGVEIYTEIAGFAAIAGAILDEIDLADNRVDFPGVYDYEVAEEFAREWQAETILGIYEPEASRKRLGKLTYDFFNQDGQITEFTKNVILKHTGYSAN